MADQDNISGSGSTDYKQNGIGREEEFNTEDESHASQIGGTNNSDNMGEGMEDDDEIF